MKILIDKKDNIHKVIAHRKKKKIIEMLLSSCGVSWEQWTDSAHPQREHPSVAKCPGGRRSESRRMPEMEDNGDAFFGNRGGWY